MKASAAGFDAGHIGEAKRMAVSLRVLLHQTAKSHSILGQLGERQKEMVDTAFPYNARNLLTHQGLVVIRAGQGASFEAPLGSLPVPAKRRRFSDWWEADAVLKDTNGATYTRRQLVLFAANKDGGAHVDPELHEEFEKLRDGSGTGWVVSSSTGEGLIPDAVAHSIRQITFEAVESLS